MTPIEAFVGWLGNKADGYIATRGLWRESSARPEQKF